MTLKCHSYNSTRFSCRFGNLLKSTSKYYTLNVMTFLVWKILNSRPKVPFINYSSGNYGKLLEKYWHYPLWTNTSWKNGFCLKYFNISFNISGKQYTSRLYLLINCFFVCFFFLFFFFYPLDKKQCSATVLKKNTNTNTKFTRPWWCFSKVPVLLARTRSLTLSYKASDMSYRHCKLSFLDSNYGLST